tara:strand:- start:3796 stop:4596 length:801 start_codon:yes stop_codon:yes gene_type:complete
MSKKINIAVITQNDEFAIPKNFKLLCDAENIQVSELIIINAPSSLENKKFLFIKGFGVKQSIKMVIVKLTFKLRSFVASTFSFIQRTDWLNLKAMCSFYEIPIRYEVNINSEKVLKRLSKKNLDVVVSFSAPTVFKDDLLNLPRYGCINLHCSALPSYAGVLPSFWVLFNNETKAGMSVHVMDSKIDNGEVLAQDTIDISSIDNMFDVIQATKLNGGRMMLRVLDSIYENNKLPEPVDTSQNTASYFSWPKVDDLKSLALRGKRLI